MARLVRLFALFVVVALVILGGLVGEIRTSQQGHFTAGKNERALIIKQNREILQLLKEGR